MKLSGNFAFPTMLQPVAWLRKIENWKLQSIFNFFFQPKHSKSLTELLKREGLHLHSYFFCPCPPPSPPRLHFSGKEEAEIHIYHTVTLPNMNNFSAEYMKDLVITQRKTHSKVSLLPKERFPDKKGFILRSVRRFCFEKWWAWAVHSRHCCSGKYKFIKLKCLLFTIFFFFLPSLLCLYSHLYEHPSEFKIVFQLFAWICRLLSRFIFFVHQYAPIRSLRSF